MSAETELINALKANAALIALVPAARITPVKRLQGGSLPAITVERIANTPVQSIAGDTSQLDQVRLRVNCWAKTYQSTKEIAEAVRPVVATLNSHIITDQDLYEDDTQIYRVASDYYVWQRVFITHALTAMNITAGTPVFGTPTLASGWTPADLTGLVAWYDPNDLATVWQDAAGTTPGAVGQPVGRIDDKSGNGYNATQSTADARPTLVDSGSGFLEMDGDGVDDGLAMLTGATADRTVAIVMHSDVSAVGVGIGADSNNMVRYISSGTGVYWNIRSSDPQQNYTLTRALALDTRAICIGRGDASELNFEINGSAATPLTPNSAPVSSTWSSLMNRAGTQHLNGAIAEVVIYDNSISDDDLILLRDYLATNNGITL